MTLAAQDIPVAIVFYNRSDHLSRLIDNLREFRPRNVFLVADGPRADKDGDSDACEHARRVAEGVDWTDRIEQNYAPQNLGCRKRVETGLDWIFDRVESAIVLEDDCLPNFSFFHFVAEMLDRYRNDPRVIHIAGGNRGLSPKYFQSSYAFSRYPLVWGWATWRRAWALYSDNMQYWPTLRNNGWLESILDSSRTVKYWKREYDLLSEGRLDSWAYRWQMAMWLNNRLAVLPKHNMVDNIGFGSTGTHTTDESHWQGDLTPREMGFPLRHPRRITHHPRVDFRLQHDIYNPRRRRRRYLRLKRYLSRRRQSAT